MHLEIDVQKQLSFKQSSFELALKLNTSFQTLAIMGPSGAGKSMFLKCLAGLEFSVGRIVLDDMLLQDIAPKASLAKTCFAHSKKVFVPVKKRNFALVPQHYCLYPHLTVQQNIAFNLKQGWFNPSPNFTNEHIEHLLHLFDLEQLRNLYPQHLSQGQKQRTAMARALVTRPRLLLLDEPFSALDAHLKAKLREDLKRILELQGICTIMVTHDVEDVRALADQQVFIEHGRIVEDVH